MGFTLGLGFRVWGLGFGVWGAVLSLGFPLVAFVGLGTLWRKSRYVVSRGLGSEVRHEPSIRTAYEERPLGLGY